MADQSAIALHWFRRDLRLEDNRALAAALKSGLPVLPVFIFDTSILDALDKADRRITFIADRVRDLRQALQKLGGTLAVFHGKPEEIYSRLLSSHRVAAVFCNEDYEPYAREGDRKIAGLCAAAGASFTAVKDHVIFSPAEITKDDGSPYQVFTPYSRRWLEAFESALPTVHAELPRGRFAEPVASEDFSPERLGFIRYTGSFPSAQIDLAVIAEYDKTRDLPAVQGTSRLGMHLRFGTISVRRLALSAYSLNRKFLSELIWREFYQMILWYYPHTASRPFKSQYDSLVFPGSQSDFERWSAAETGYPLVDAGIRELVETGFMHNRVRMVVASFLTKHLLCDWRWGERFFARHLNDFELASNVGGWQWCAGIGADAAPYFRIFNPSEQQKKFDPGGEYLARWLGTEEDNFFGTPMDRMSEVARSHGWRQRPKDRMSEGARSHGWRQRPKDRMSEGARSHGWRQRPMEPMIDHRFARERCLKFFSAVHR